MSNEAAKRSAPTAPYDLTVTFGGLVSFVTEAAKAGGAGKTTRRLWALLPQALKMGDILKLEPKIRNFGKFLPSHHAHHVPHFPFIRVRAGDLLHETAPLHPDAKIYISLAAREPLDPHPRRGGRYDVTIETGGMHEAPVRLSDFDLVTPVRDGRAWARVGRKVASTQVPETVNGTEIPLVARLSFGHGETAVARRPPTTTGRRVAARSQDIAASVDVVRAGVTGFTTIHLRDLGGAQSRHTFRLLPAPGRPLQVEIVNLPAQELFGLPADQAHPNEYSHFKLAYLIAPKPQGAGQGYVWNYSDYHAPPRPDWPRYDDAFCTPLSRLAPPQEAGRGRADGRSGRRAASGRARGRRS